MQIDMRDAGRCLFWLGHVQREECRVRQCLGNKPQELVGEEGLKEKCIGKRVFSLGEWQVEEGAPKLEAGGDPRNNKNDSDLR